MLSKRYVPLHQECHEVWAFHRRVVQNLEGGTVAAVELGAGTGGTRDDAGLFTDALG